MLLACAGFLAVGQVLIGAIARPLPDLLVLGVTALLPLALAERIVRSPGAATAVCGAYLLPRATISLLAPAIPPPPLLLVPAIAFDLVLWLGMSHVIGLRELWPRRRDIWRKRPRPSSNRPLSHGRGLLAGGVFGLVLSLVEPGYQVFLGADAATWSGPLLWLAGALTTLTCGGLATLVSVQDTAS